MTDTPAPSPTGLARIFAPPRLGFTLLVALGFALMHAGSSTSLLVWFGRTSAIALAALVMFGVFERWPARLPSWLPRWAVQVVTVVAVLPFAALFSMGVGSGLSMDTMMGDPSRRAQFYSLLAPAIFFGPWIALGAIVRQREALARHQALTFQLERSELERKAVDARLGLLQAQVQPHFLFNTLANVRALVKAGSPQAPAVLDSLIAYLRAAVPTLSEAQSTMARELELVRAYLELMYMRMPDRLQFSVHADDAALNLRCPPVTVLTLVENAVRHGIDPSEEGGRIDVSVMLRDGRCIVRVTDSGVGLQAAGSAAGTGLDTLRERMRLAFGDAQLRLAGTTPHGMCAELEFPAQPPTA